MASSSAAERSATTPELRQHRGRQVVLVFSNQGMGRCGGHDVRHKQSTVIHTNIHTF